MAPSKSADESDACMRQRLVNSLSQSFPGSALSKALQCLTDSEDEMKADPLSSSCFAELRTEKLDVEEDDELTSLSWLQDSDLLKNINAGEGADEVDGQKENGEAGKLTPGFSQPHPPHVPYNPQKHINSKPPYSFSCLIFMAIEDSPIKRLPVKDIYNWILTHFPYFQNAPTGWKNSVRHNLSLNKCFKKVEKDKGQSIGKGSLWCIDPDFRPNLLQALRKTPYHPYHQLQMMSSPQSNMQLPVLPPGCHRPFPLSPRSAPNTISPHLFPFLSKRLAQTASDIDSEITDVAYTLVSLKGFSSKNSSGMSSDGSEGSLDPRFRYKRKFRDHGYIRRRPSGPIICTNSPSEDHTYSATTVAPDEDDYMPSSPVSSIDDEYDFGPDDDVESDSPSYHSDYDYGSDMDEVDGETSTQQRKRFRDSKTTEEEEQKKIVEGADALLNLAGIMTRSPRRSPRSVLSKTDFKARSSPS
ncbi:forkhead box protein N3-like [Haliotis rubra]|uniref:forkhead box protein N3-like n=1 Tax=Haliotis rubra TaxID=36100 RepID=UPI001EE58262|nr:forkhead box protein N3-like [Haliotis rubra]XP_046561940.1 forkhead box protein N3-like [Haliotis rubra]XP_046561941.1 forkhead box protein N3-like [Haliotis rubra]